VADNHPDGFDVYTDGPQPAQLAPPNGHDGWRWPTEIPESAADGDPDDTVDVEQGAEATSTPPPAFTFDPAPYAFPNPASIPAREWLYGRHYIRGAVSATIGAPGRLKSTTVLTEIVGMTVGRDLMTGEALASGPLRAAYFNGEETQDELDRRVAAICQRFGLKPEDCGGRLWVCSTRDKPIRVAIRGPRGDAMVQAAVVTALADWCDQRQVDAIAVDPLISFHAVRESDNGDMDLVCKEAFGVIAGKTRAVDMVHHPRKLAPGESSTTVDDARGASAVLGAVRVARTLNFMTTAEAAQLGIAEDDRRRHVRIENGKNNPGPIGKAHWARIETEILPNGDEVAVSSSWTPPNPFDGVTVDDLRLVQKVVKTGEFRADSRSPDWLGWWMAENLPRLNIKSRHGEKPCIKAEMMRLNSILTTWLKNNALAKEDRPDEKSRKRSFFILGLEAEAIPTSRSTHEDDDQITLP
jgi:AAA domain